MYDHYMYREIIILKSNFTPVPEFHVYLLSFRCSCSFNIKAGLPHNHKIIEYTTF